MKWFGFKSGRAEARPVLARGFAFAGEWPPSYEAQVRQGYLANPVAQRAVKLVAQSVADAPLDASDDLAALIGVELLEGIATHLQLHGNAYVQVLRDADGRPAGLFALRPERVRVEADASGWPAAYRYAVGERVQRLIADAQAPEVIHLRLTHPLDDHYGLGCLGAAAGAIAVHNAASGWNSALLDNAARPSGALVYDPGDGSTLSREQFERLFDETLTTVAICWRVERRDGVTIGLTDHDRDLAIDGVVHKAAPGMRGSCCWRRRAQRRCRSRRCLGRRSW